MAAPVTSFNVHEEDGSMVLNHSGLRFRRLREVTRIGLLRGAEKKHRPHVEIEELLKVNPREKVPRTQLTAT
jgi:hypothetical protein